MYLQHLHLLNFKNYEDREFRFVPGINCITGDNGVGKTNLLDAVHYLCFSKSFMNPADSQNILHQAPFFVVEGTFWREGREELLYCALKRGQKKQFKRNKKEYERLSDHIGLFPLVVISPLDAVLVTGGSEERRRFMDSLISQFDHAYLDQLIAYNRVLQQRNALLKQMAQSRMNDPDTLEIYNEQLVMYGEALHQRRQAFIQDFIPVFSHYYTLIAGTGEQAGLAYSSHLGGEMAFADLLRQSADRDRALQYTSVGIHKDDLEFRLNDFAMKRFGSQGQQKSYLTALKLAEHEYLERKTGFGPILLLDDIFDKLDAQRVGRLIAEVGREGFGQVFITDTGKEKISGLFSKFGVNATFIEL